MSALQRIRSDEFIEAAFPISSARGLRAMLRARPEVVDLRRELTSGALTPSHVQTFVGELLSQLQRGRKLTEEVVLAAIAVAMETLPGSFAHSYLSDLAGLEIQEIPLAPGVARHALDRRKTVLVESTEGVDVSARLEEVANEFRVRFFDADCSDDTLRVAS